jgi:hypothetical protein
MGVFVKGLFAFLSLVFVSSVAFAANLPECFDRDGNSMRVDNARVLRMKRETKNQYKDRAFVQGVLVGVVQERKSHLHLDVFLGETPDGRGKDSDIEIIHNKAFSAPNGRELTAGMEVAVCGDFINAFKQAGNYPPSPMGAIIHWTHMSTRSNHPAGFVVIDGEVFGDRFAKPRGGNRDDEDFVSASFMNFYKLAM